MGDFTDAIDRITGSQGDKTAKYDDLFASSGAKYGIDPELLKGIARTESSFNPNAVSHDDSGKPIAHGLMQFTPATAAGVGIVDPYDPAQSVDGAAKLMRANLDASGGDTHKALMMYHGGPNQAIWGPKTQAYPGKVLGQTAAQVAPDVPDTSFTSAIDRITSSQVPASDAIPAPNANVPKMTITGQRLQAPEPSFGEKIIGAGEAGLNLITGAASAIPAGVMAIGNALTNGKYGTQEGVNEAGDAFQKTQNSLTFQPRTDTGKQYAGVVGDAVNDSGIVGLGPMVNMHGISEASKPGLEIASNRLKSPPVALSSIDSGRVEPTLNGMPARPMAGGGAASVNSNPYPQLTGEEAARGGSSAFPQIKVSKIGADVPFSEQAVRAQISNTVLGEDNNAVRTGVVTGNENTLRAEATQAKHPDQTPAQAAIRQQFVREQDALSQYAQDRIHATGASPTLINPEQRGQVINDAFHGDDGLMGYFKQAKQQIYDQAKVESGDNRIATSHVDSLLSDPQFLAEAERNGHSGVVSGAQKLINLAHEVGFKNSRTGEVTAPGSVSAWDAVRKSNNSGWTHDNAGTIGAINEAIDRDVASAGGSEMYALGDKIHQAEKSIMGSKGIKNVFGESDPNGVKEGVPLENITSKLNNLPMDQWRHINSTLDELSRGQLRGAPESMPPVSSEMQQMAMRAKNEIAGSLAREVYEKGASKIGAWNQNSANTTLNSVVGQKILESFPPDEVQAFHTLNYAGQIMPGMHAYEGSALQGARVNSGPNFIESYAPASGAVLGLHTVGPIGAVGGQKIGNLLSGKMKGKRLTGEGNMLLDAMRNNADLGK